MLVYTRPTKGKTNDTKKAKEKTKPKDGAKAHQQRARARSLDHGRDHEHPPPMTFGSLPQPSYQQPVIQYYPYPVYPQQPQLVSPTPPNFSTSPAIQVPYFCPQQAPQPGQPWQNQLQTAPSTDAIWVGAEQASNYYINDPRHATNEFAHPTQRGPGFDLVAAKLNSVLTSIDGEVFSGNEADLAFQEQGEIETPLRGGWGFPNSRDISRAMNTATTAVKGPRSINYFAKVSLYANSRLPPNLPSLRL